MDIFPFRALINRGTSQQLALLCSQVQNFYEERRQMKLKLFSTLFIIFFLYSAVPCFSQPSAKDLKIMQILENSRELGKGEKWALLIGIEKYDDGEINPLRYTVSDVKALHEVLIDKERGMFKSEKVKLLTSDSKDKRSKPTKVNILFYLKEWLGQNVKEEDTVLIYFSGHGAVWENKKYLLPIDTDTFYMPAYAIDNREFIEGIDNLKSKKVITILDSCHSGGVSRAGKGIGDFLPEDFYTEFETSEGKVTLASCKGSEQSFEWPEKQHGVFTYYLIEGLTGAANKDDQAVTFSEVAEYVYEKVKKWAKEKGVEQTPSRHMESMSGKIAVTFDLETGVEVAIEMIKKKMRQFLGTGKNKLSPKEIKSANTVLDSVLAKHHQKQLLSNDEDTALAVISSLIKGEFSVSDYKDFGDVIERAAESTLESTSPPKPSGFGTVKVLATPWADVYLDGKYIDRTPKIIEKVAVGKHTITLRRTGYKEVTRQIQVKADEAKKVSEALEKE